MNTGDATHEKKAEAVGQAEQEVSTSVPCAAASKWVPVRDRLPEPSVKVLLRTRYRSRNTGEVSMDTHIGYKIPVNRNINGWYVVGKGPYEENEVTHWAELYSPTENNASSGGAE